MLIRENIRLAEYTTIRLGGPARWFCSCATTDELREALKFAASKRMRAHLLAGGSNTVFADAGFDGLVMKADMQGVEFTDDGEHVLASVQAGEEWEPFTRTAVEKGFAGVECLSGIPGSVGAVPVQNVGAYGQEVKDTIVSVTALDRTTLDTVTFSNDECRFGYRHSRFKAEDAGRYIVTSVLFRLKKNGRPVIGYPEVRKAVEAAVPLATLADGRESLTAVRNIVLALRRKKSMVIDPSDPNTRSVGSFFMNPVVTDEQLWSMKERWKSIGDGTEMPLFASEGRTKVPAAWLIERSGFAKGYTKDRVGISENHTLALVNRGGTTASLVALAEEIRDGVFRTFGVRLEPEANIIP
ncbi:MAG: UDP-N-acetylmuramate dehydrogenase [Bacteroidetes bacterium]|nr:MAG: UDP-N-acetylmuramate dehydrogenase [Bacteroidota bacterium]